METHIHEIVDEMNALRKQSNQLGCGVVLLFFLPIPFIIAIPLLLFMGSNNGSGTMVTIVLFLIYIFVVSIGAKFMGASQKKKLDKIKRLYKETFMKGVLEEFFGDVDYRWNAGMSQQQFFATDIFKEYKLSRYHSEDYLSGSYKGVPFKQSDIVAERKRDDHTMTVFSGRLLEFDYSLKQVQSVKVVPQRVIEAREHFQIEAQEIVKMESVEFNEIFAVASKSPQDAFYVLTPQVMERLITIWEKYSKSALDDGIRQNIEGMYRSIVFHFRQDKLYVAVDHMDSFDSNLIKEIDYPTEKEKIRKHIQVIIDIIEILKLINA